MTDLPQDALEQAPETITGSPAADDFQTLHEIVAAAHRALDRNLWDYVAGATETETTMRRNRLALDRIAFRPRVLNDVSRIDSGAEFLGKSVRLPVAFAPVGGLESLGHEGALTVARAAEEAGVAIFPQLREPARAGTGGGSGGRAQGVPALRARRGRLRGRPRAPGDRRGVRRVLHHRG